MRKARHSISRAGLKNSEGNSTAYHERGGSGADMTGLFGISEPAASRVLQFLLLIVLITAGVQRVVPAWQFVYPGDGEVRLLGIDAYFHLRHAQFIGQNPGSLPRQDYGAHYPGGYPDDATGLFGIAVGGAAGLIGLGSPDIDLVANIAAWTPPLLGLLVVFMIFLLGKSLGGPLIGTLASLLYLSFPGTSLNRSLLGFADHHVVEMLLSVSVLFGWTRAIQISGASKDVKLWRPSFLLGAPFFLLFFAWVGAPVYIVYAAVLVVILSAYLAAKGGGLFRFAEACFRFFSPQVIVFSAAWLLFPNLIVIPKETIRLLVLTASVLLAVGPLLVAFAVEWLRRTRLSNPVIGLAVLAVATSAFLVFFLGTDAGAVGFRAVFEERTIAVREQQFVDWTVVFANLGSSGVLAVLALPLVLVRYWRREGGEDRLLVVLMSLLSIFIWWQTHDFDYIPSALVAVAGALTLGALVERIVVGRQTGRSTDRKHPKKSDRSARRKSAGKLTGKSARSTGSRRKERRPSSTASNPVRSAAGVLIVAAAAIGPWWPHPYTVRPWLPEAIMQSFTVFSQGWFDSMTWLRENTPPPYPDVSGNGVSPIVDRPPAYGVMTAWDFGNLVAAYGNRAPAYSRYPDKREGLFFLASSEKEAESGLCLACTEDESIPYVIVDSRTAGDFFAMKGDLSGRRPVLENRGSFFIKTLGRSIPRATYGASFDSSMTARLYMNDGIGLGRYRLIYESVEQSFTAYLGNFTFSGTGQVTSDVKRITIVLDRYADADELKRIARMPVVQSGSSFLYGGKIASTVKIFEHVPGVRLSGTAVPGATVRVLLPISIKTTGRSFTYERIAHTGPNGKFSMRLPYATIQDTTRAVYPTADYGILVATDDTGLSTIVGSFAVTTEDVDRGASFTVDLRSNSLVLTRNPSNE